MARACILVALLAVACTATVSSAVFTSTSGIGTWTDLFQYPSKTPKIITHVSCNTDTSCYVNSYESLFSFNGVPNGTFTPRETPNFPEISGEISAIVASGPLDSPGGAVMFSSLDVPIFYPVNRTTFEPSKAKFPKIGGFDAQDARASANGREVLVIDEECVLYSSNGGKDFILKTINVTLVDNRTSPRFGSMVDKNTWYVTMGSFGDVRNGRFFTAQIVKTTDGGNTWTTQFARKADFLFNAIECLSATHCVAVAEGGLGAYIYRTVDGKHWNVEYGPSTGVLRYLRASAHGNLFAAGFKEGESYMLTSVDGGATWVEESPIPHVKAISGLSFTPGGVGFATAQRDDHFGGSTILRYDPSQLLH